MSSFFFTFFHFNSLLCPERHGHAWILPEAWAILREKGAILGELASVLVGRGSKVWVQVEKKVSESGSGELWENFCGRVSITTPSPDLSGI